MREASLASTLDLGQRSAAAAANVAAVAAINNAAAIKALAASPGWNGMAPRATESDRQGATQRPIQAGAHSSNSLEADPAPFGSNHATPHADARMQVRDE